MPIQRSPSLERPTQAVILAGGRGTRLRPLTDTRPKPMVEIHGKPFLEYLVECRAGQGLGGFFCLLDFCPEVIQNNFVVGPDWGGRFDYAFLDVVERP